ncbi:DNA-deoxyinosine glycosylase [Zunongwangia endophytica]|uniref:DNA-deoxyinosine glycosylase n=1 Tax=Zunongwangia endophytica TaxID=1808945 RepID=A0ABV8HFH7_9FLAO|nr:DNA-deoxyinosine glycosylase [Zunongwangia endophytica]MDN3594165.1 DNA-deoxyinosine glycosylase [Zunongwangia endophytica]
MTLHSAIELVLKKKNKAMTTQEIADDLNKKGLYQKKDKSEITAFQVHGRTRKYSHLFERNGSLVSLSKEQKTDKKKSRKIETDTFTKSSFEPITNKNIEILILGTLPGDKSIELQEYYAHSRNRFWKIISRITNSQLPENYDEKKILLAKSKIAVRDVAHKADRKGSLDTAIFKEEPNDLNRFIKIHPNLKTIVFNGKKTESLFDKYFIRKENFKYYSLPSTSPANARYSLDKIVEVWKKIIK